MSNLHNHQLTLGLIFNPTNLTTKALTLIAKLHPIIPLGQNNIAHLFLLVTGHLLYTYYRHFTTPTFSLQRLAIPQGSDSPLDKLQSKHLTRILASDIRPCSFLTIVIGAHALNNLSINRHTPNLPLPNLGKGTDKIIHASRLLHLKLSLSFFLLSLYIYYRHLSIG